MWQLSPIDIYYTNRVKQLEKMRTGNKKFTIPKKFYQNPESKVFYNYLNQGHDGSTGLIPTKMEVFNYQHDILKKAYAPYKAELKKMLPKLNNDLENTHLLNYDATLEQAIKIIEDTFGTILNKDGDTLESILNDAKQGYLNASKYQKFLNLLRKTYNTLMNGEYNKQLGTYLDNIQNFIDSNSNIKIVKNEIKNKKTGFLWSLQKIGYGLKGAYFQYLVADWLKRTINIEDLIIADTDSNKLTEIHQGFTGPTSNTAKKSISDLLIFKTKNNQEKSLTKILEKAEKANGKKNTISTLVNDYGAIGIQIKSGWFQSPVNSNSKRKEGTTATLIQAISLSENNTLKYLYLLQKEKRAHFTIANQDTSLKKEVYTPLVEYALSKTMNKVLGERNALIASREGLMFMDEYLYNNKRYIGISSSGSDGVRIDKLHKKLYLSMRRV